jgi:hypothetical protein
MRKIKFLLIIISSAIIFNGCTKTPASIYPNLSGPTSTIKMSNGWWINVSIMGQAGNLLSKPVFFETYNASSNVSDSLWIDDLGNFWNFKVLATSDYLNLTFKGTGLINNYYLDTVNINNGKILPKAGHSRAGNITDSIYMEVKFSDDSPAYGNTYIIAGTARTGFIEDDY